MAGELERHQRPFESRGFFGIDILQQVGDSATGSPEAVCNMSDTWFFRRASKNFSPTLTAISTSAKTTKKETIRRWAS